LTILKLSPHQTIIMKQRIATVFLAGAIGVSAAPSSGCGLSPGLESGPQTINVNGQDRQFIVRVPEGYNNTKPYRLIFGIHWWGGSMDDVAYGQTVEPGVWNYYGLERLAEETAIFVAPQGIDGNWYNEGGSDYAFFDEINRLVEDSLCVDTDLRFSIGFSWGGSTSVGIACRDSEFPFRAITAIAAAGPFECKLAIYNWHPPNITGLTRTGTGNPGTAPVGYLGIHGIADNPDNGRSMRDRFANNNGCTGEEKPQPAPGSLSHVQSDYQCSGPPVAWVTFVSSIKSVIENTEGFQVLTLFIRTADIFRLLGMVVRETMDRRVTFQAMPGICSAHSRLLIRPFHAKTPSPSALSANGKSWDHPVRLTLLE
jgi:poly(3-hydroxybutyrate) depolymerase